MAVPGLLEGLFAVAFFIFITLYSRNNHGLPKNLPIVGMWPYLLLHLSHLHDWATDLLAKTTRTFLFKGLWITGAEMVVTADPANVNYILNTNFVNFPKGPEFGEIFDIFGNATVTLDFEPWKVQRKIAHLILANAQFKKFVDRSMLVKLQNGFLPVLDLFTKNGEPADFQDIVQRLMFDVNFLAVNGHDPVSLSVDLPQMALLKAMDEVEEALFLRHALPKVVWKFLRWLNVGHERIYKKAWKTLDVGMADVISLKRKEKEEAKNDDGDGTGFSVLEFYLRDNDYGDKLLRDLMLGFLIAGKNTVSAAFVWLIWLLSSHKDAEWKIREEINSLLPPDERGRRRVFNAAEVKGMTYLHCALCETMRLYPPVPFELKVPAAPDTLPSGHRVYPKQKIILFFYSMGRMASIWGDDCREFKPERWISERGGVKAEPPHKFTAFNAGPRSCIGKEISFTQLKMMAAALLHNYDIHVLEKQDLSPANSLILLMKNGLKVKITDRWR